MTVQLDGFTRNLLDRKNFPIVATVGPDGSARGSVIWAHRHDNHAVFMVARGGRKHRDILRDNRISLSLFDVEDPYRSVEIRGIAEVTEENSYELAHELIEKYTGEKNTTIDEPPVFVRLIPTALLHYPKQS
ncbi:pyridoxamine 5'-phosphate oxidase family protein [Nocardia sp. NPDC059195]|uniref:pyridoxamine 5'-phosphate oxidase family protein n=1 Tax=Nocardia sp. NPDC059195 TaxID=3346765 RepID=UPI0036AE4963